MSLIQRIGTAGGLAMVLIAPAFGHGVAAGSDRFSALPWSWDPLILSCLGLALFGYVCGLIRLAPKARTRIVGRVRCTSFLSGLAVLFIALISPFDALDDQLFSAHMVQHLLLMSVAPPLLVWGRPGIVFLWAFPLPARRSIGRVWSGSGLAGGFRALMAPLVVWSVASAMLCVWHLPALYDDAIANEAVHTLEHACFFVTSLMFWTLVLEPFGRRRLDYGGTMIFVATFGVEMGFLGALLTFAGHPFYPAHLTTTQAWGLTPLEDQQLAGLIMWIPASFIYLIALGALFVAWMRDAERAADRATLARKRASSDVRVLRYGLFVLIAGALMSLAGCGQRNPPTPWAIDGADAAQGPVLMRHYGCVSCHAIPGVDGARGQVGPSLDQFGRRTYIAGVLRNEPDNLVRWLRAPQSVVPGNAMPDTGVTERDARDIAAYLYQLQ